MTSKKQVAAAAYIIAIIYVKPIEMNAITVMVDEFHESVPIRLADENEYTLGRIGKHNVVIAGPPRGAQGKAAAADVVSRIRLTFPNIRMGLLVGIGGGAPSPPERDVRLGDVVVGAPESGPAVVQYDLGKQTTDDIVVVRTLNKPPNLLLRVVNKVDDEYQRAQEDEDFFTVHLERYTKFRRMKDRFKRPSVPDRLFKADFEHNGEPCDSHDFQYEVPRDHRDPNEVQIHYSTILSGDLVMKSGIRRGQLSQKYNNALCFEMEAAGLMDVFPCLVIRGICDYADSHKNKDWQEYAAATAACYAREILLTMAERAERAEDANLDQIETWRSPGGHKSIRSPVPITFSGDNTGIQLGQNYGVIGNIHFGH